LVTRWPSTACLGSRVLDILRLKHLGCLRMLRICDDKVVNVIIIYDVSDVLTLLVVTWILSTTKLSVLALFVPLTFSILPAKLTLQFRLLLHGILSSILLWMSVSLVVFIKVDKIVALFDMICLAFTFLTIIHIRWFIAVSSSVLLGVVIWLAPFVASSILELLLIFVRFVGVLNYYSFFFVIVVELRFLLRVIFFVKQIRSCKHF